MQRALLLLALPVHTCATGQYCVPPCSPAPSAPAASDVSRGFSQRHTGNGTTALALASGRRHQHKLHPQASGDRTESTRFGSRPQESRRDRRHHSDERARKRARKTPHGGDPAWDAAQSSSAPPSAVSEGGDFPVDVVYTWAGAPPEEQLVERAKVCPGEGGARRWRDLGVFQISIENTIKNLPWVRTIWIVTDGEVPCWLPTDFEVLRAAGKGSAHSRPQIRFVSHADIIARDALPVYASNPIEANLVNIPGLAEHFIYLNDDHVVLKPLQRSDFFDSRGMARIMTTQHHFDEVLQNSARDVANWPPTAPGAAMLDHMAFVFKKSWIQDVHATWPLLFDKVARAKCRSSSPVAPPWVYQWYGIVKGGAQPSTGISFEFIWRKPVGLEDLFSVKARQQNLENYFQRLRAMSPHVICINDDFDTSGDERVLTAQLAVLNKYFDEIRPPKPQVINESLCHTRYLDMRPWRALTNESQQTTFERNSRPRRQRAGTLGWLAGGATAPRDRFNLVTFVLMSAGGKLARQRLKAARVGWLSIVPERAYYVFVTNRRLMKDHVTGLHLLNAIRFAVRRDVATGRAGTVRWYMIGDDDTHWNVGASIAFALGDGVRSRSNPRSERLAVGNTYDLGNTVSCSYATSGSPTRAPISRAGGRRLFANGAARQGYSAAPATAFDRFQMSRGWFTGGSGVAISYAAASEIANASHARRGAWGHNGVGCGCSDIPLACALAEIGASRIHRPTQFLKTCLDCRGMRSGAPPVISCNAATAFRPSNPHASYVACVSHRDHPNTEP